MNAQKQIQWHWHTCIGADTNTRTRRPSGRIHSHLRQIFRSHIHCHFWWCGHEPANQQAQKGVDLLVATPGRLLDLQQQGMLDLGQVQVLILDEADRMLDMGFIHDVKKYWLYYRNKNKACCFQPHSVMKFAIWLRIC